MTDEITHARSDGESIEIYRCYSKVEDGVENDGYMMIFHQCDARPERTCIRVTHKEAQRLAAIMPTYEGDPSHE